jgi:hypothetical protein
LAPDRQARRYDAGDEQAQRAEFRPGEYAGHEAVRDDRDQPTLAQDDGRDRHDHYSAGDKAGRHLVDRVGKLNSRVMIHSFA